MASQLRQGRASLEADRVSHVFFILSFSPFPSHPFLQLFIQYTSVGRAPMADQPSIPGPDVSAFDFAYAAYVSSIKNNPSANAEITSLIAANPSFSSAIGELLPTSLDFRSLSTPPTYISNFPSSVQPFLQSIHSIEIFIATSNRLITVVTPSTDSQTPILSSNPSLESILIDPSASPASSIIVNPTIVSTTSTSFTRTTVSTTSTSFTTTTAPTTSTSSSQAAAAISSSVGDSSSISGGGLSSSARIGIGVGVAVGGLLILLLAFVIIRLMRRTRRLANQLEERRMMDPGVAVTEPWAGPGVAVTEVKAGPGIAISEQR